MCIRDRYRRSCRCSRARHAEGWSVVRRSVRYGLQALILLTLLAASIAWIRADKTVTVSVDGSPRQLRTLASTVGGLLDRADIAVGEHDQVAPGREAPVRDGAQISVRRGRQPVSYTH